MAKRELHSRAIELRMQGWSYTQIKDHLRVSKGTLSIWLRDYPLSDERLRELRDNNAQRIERYRATRARTREARVAIVRERVASDIGTLSGRDFLIAGLFLYWGEGSKTQYSTVCVSNTDPSVLIFFIKWLELLGVPRESLRVYVHLYVDMDSKKEFTYWSKTLNLPRTVFRKPYIKKSARTNLTYKQKFTHGTCNVMYHNRDIAEYVHAGIVALQTSFVAPAG